MSAAKHTPGPLPVKVERTCPRCRTRAYQRGNDKGIVNRIACVNCGHEWTGRIRNDEQRHETRDEFIDRIGTDDKLAESIARGRERQAARVKAAVDATYDPDYMEPAGRAAIAKATGSAA